MNNSNCFIIILYAKILNGVGDFVHLRELYNLIREKFPHLNIGIDLYIEEQFYSNGLNTKKLVDRSFLINLIKNFHSKNKFLYFNITGKNLQKHRNILLLQETLNINNLNRNCLIKRINISSKLNSGNKNELKIK